MGKFDRVKLLIGSNNAQKIKDLSVMVFGIGGVGGFTVEGLVRSGVENITVIDSDVVSETNINRQIIATTKTVGKSKVEVIKERALEINENVNVKTINAFVLPENITQIDFSGVDYIVDAVDTVSAKLAIIKKAKELSIPVISCMGTGGKLDVTSLRVGDVFETKGCPLARVMRRELKKLGVTELKTVYSTEQVSISEQDKDLLEQKGKDRTAPPSMIFVPATAGLMLAEQVILDSIKD